MRLFHNITRLPSTHNLARRPLHPALQRYSAGQMDVICHYCGSLSFHNEHFKCCHEGKVHLDDFTFPPALQELFQSADELGVNFRQNIRRYNTAFAFSSLSANLEPPPGRGPPVFRVCGQMYHSYASLYPNNNNPPSFNQLYVFQPSEANSIRLLNPVTGRCRPDVMDIIGNVLNDVNPYAYWYEQMAQVERRAQETAERDNLPLPVVSLHMRTGPDRRRYNQPEHDEVAAIFTSADGAPNYPRDVVVYPKSRSVRQISYLSPNLDPMSYPLFFPNGEPGWSVGIPHVGPNVTEHRNSVTPLQYCTYRWADRGRFNPLLHGCYLTQQKMVDDYMKVDSSRIDFLRQNQSTLRCETLQGLYDHVYAGLGQPASQTTVFPPSFPSSQESILFSQSSEEPEFDDDVIIASQDSIAPHLDDNILLNATFLNTTGSPLENENDDFSSSLDQPLNSHTEDLPLSPNPSPTSSTQPALGLSSPAAPHDHLPGNIVILPSSYQGSPRNMTEAYHDAMAICRNFGAPDLFVTFTCNEKWPEIIENLKPGQQPHDRPDLIARVFQIYRNDILKDITERHVLGKCIAQIHVIEFQKRGKPHAHILIHFDENDKLRTPEDIDSLISAEIPDPDLYPALHAIVTSCMMHGPCGVLNKNSPCMEKDKCSKNYPKPFSQHTLFNDGGYPTYKRPDNGRIFRKGTIDLSNQWVVPYNPYLLLKYGSHINVEACVSIKSIKYVYKYVYKGHDCANMELNVDEIKTYLDCRYVCAPEAAHHLFEFKMRGTSHSVERLPVHLPDMQSIFFQPGDEAEAVATALEKETKLTAWFSLNQTDELARQFLYADIPLHFCWTGNKWQGRKRSRKVVSRLYHVTPKDVERYHLRLLLLNVPGATSFNFLLTVDGVVCKTFQEACRRRNLIHDDSVWKDTLQEASHAGLPHQLRQMFAFIILNCEVSNARQLFDHFLPYLIEDHIRAGDSPSLSEQKALAHIEKILKNNSRSLQYFQLPEVYNLTPTSPINYNVYDEIDIRGELESSLTREQLRIANEICSRIQTNKPPLSSNLFFIDGPGGSGKTYLYNYLIHRLRSFELTYFASAMTGIAATLLLDGRTTHSTFKIPIPCCEGDTIKISPSSDYADELRKAQMLLIDEASMLPANAFKAIDLLLRDIMSNNIPFGGKIVVMGGDFRQILPVIRRANNTVLLENCITSSPLWRLVEKFKLTSNMRVNPEQHDFRDWLLELGNGHLPTRQDSPFFDCIEIPSTCIIEGSLIDKIFPVEEADNETLFSSRAILCPRNKDAIEMNSVVLTRLPGQERCYSSVDSLEQIEGMSEEEAENYPIEFLNSLTPTGMPNHNLFLKEGAICMLLRNIDTNDGQTNGTRIIIRHMHTHYLDVEVLTGVSKGKRVLLPKMSLVPSDSDIPFKLRRIQFPLRLSYAMTINKSQGQTFDRVGIYLNQPCFSHGQLYVAFSRARSFNSVFVQVVENICQGKYRGRTYTPNVIIPQVLLSTPSLPPTPPSPQSTYTSEDESSDSNES